MELVREEDVARLVEESQLVKPVEEMGEQERQEIIEEIIRAVLWRSGPLRETRWWDKVLSFSMSHER